MLPPAQLDPFIDPAWRHRRAVYLVAAGRKPDHPRDDDRSRAAWRGHHASVACADDAQREALRRHIPDVCDAYGFHNTAEPFRKAELEARLLAGQDDGVIGARIGLSPEAVLAYHDVFFCVRPRLRAENYIRSVVLGAKIHQGLSEDDRGTILKLVGFTMGQLAIDDLLEFYACPPRLPGDLSRLTQDDRKTLHHMFRMQALLAALTMPTDERSLRKVKLLEDLLIQLRTAEGGPVQMLMPLQMPQETIVESLQESWKAPGDVQVGGDTQEIGHCESLHPGRIVQEIFLHPSTASDQSNAVPRGRSRAKRICRDSTRHSQCDVVEAVAG
jgi:hypothetical protein